MNVRIGFGYDVHQLATGRKLILGGVEIPSEKGPVAHSDGDVLIHAICDALLGAAGLRDIGTHFPDNSREYKDISSMVILEKTINMLNENNYRVGNIDATLCLQQPKIMDYIGTMKEKLASAIGTGAGNISVKATTAEHLGFVGEGKGISAYAVALITGND
ncbi:MAG: 2-C-methyl-D-erythritol 2,4-cyclodiphosphate synthase [Bacteroidales bacterium]|nr:2-C-methyl-D-erythritol 2,4-cyclodiphosphate synthase [Bacteroidales bacterium]